MIVPLLFLSAVCDLNNLSIVQSIKCQEKVKKKKRSSLKSMVTSLSCVFFLTNSPKPKDT